MRKCAHSHETDVLIEVKTILLFATSAADETMIAISAVVDCDYANMNAVLCTTVNENKPKWARFFCSWRFQGNAESTALFWLDASATIALSR